MHKIYTSYYVAPLPRFVTLCLTVVPLDVLSICVINSIFIDKRGQGDDIQKVENLNIK